jgi:hypothetical protein
VTAVQTLCLKTHLTSAAAAAVLTGLMFVAVAFPPAPPARTAVLTAKVAPVSMESAA